jgi:hypothetical protein
VIQKERRREGAGGGREFAEGKSSALRRSARSMEQAPRAASSRQSASLSVFLICVEALSRRRNKTALGRKRRAQEGVCKRRYAGQALCVKPYAVVRATFARNCEGETPSRSLKNREK